MCDYLTTVYILCIQLYVVPKTAGIKFTQEAENQHFSHAGAKLISDKSPYLKTKKN